MTIDTIAPLYGPAQGEKSCLSCYMSKTHLTRGLLCLYYDLPTSREKRCGFWGAIDGAKETESGEQDLFGLGLDGG